MMRQKIFKKIIKSFKTISKILFLMVVREVYLFLRNILGVFEHPYLTFKRIYYSGDFSQEILILGLPFWFWGGWAVFLLFSRIFIFGRLKFGWMAQFSFFLVSFLSFLGLIFVFYFWEKVKKGERND